MSDRVKGFVVEKEKNYREDDIEKIKSAIMQIKGVIGVKENVANTDDYINTVRITRNVRNRLYEIAEELE